MTKNKEKPKSNIYKVMFWIFFILAIFFMFGWISASKQVDAYHNSGLICANERTDELQDELDNLKNNWNEENYAFCENEQIGKYEKSIWDLKDKVEILQRKADNFDDIDNALYDCENQLDRYERLGEYYDIRNMIEKNEFITEIYGEDIEIIDLYFNNVDYKCIED